MRICVISPNKQAYSETFIKAHIDHLDKVVGVLYGGHLPTHSMSSDLPLLSASSISRSKRLFEAKLRGKSLAEMQRASIEKWLRSNKVDLVLAEYGPSGAELVDVCHACKIPLVVHFHGIDAYHVDILNKYRNQFRNMFSSIAATIVVSKHMEDQLLDLGAVRNKLHYNPYGVDTERFSGADPAKSPPHFVSIGRFTEKKAPYLTILAFERVLTEVPDALLTMIGDGALFDPCQKLIKALKLEGSVKLSGVLSPEEVAKTLKNARAFVQHSLTPSNNDHEGMPLAIIEACATGVPVISTIHTGIPDVVEHEVSGFLSAENELDPMVGHMVRLAKDPDLAGKMGSAARERVLKLFTIEMSISALQKILEKAKNAS